MSENLIKRIEKLESRNQRVEADKRWETSYVRRVAIAILTYAFIVLYHWIVGAKNIFVVSLVPVIGFFLSTLSLKFIRYFFYK